MKKSLLVLFCIVLAFAFTGLVGCVNNDNGSQSGSVVKEDDKGNKNNDDKGNTNIDDEDYPTASVGLEFRGGIVIGIGNCTDKDIVIPKHTPDNILVTTIGDRAFLLCNEITSITIPDCVTAICELAFAGCDGLTNITIGNGVTSIGKSAFHNCSGLTSIEIPDSVTSIGDSAFAYCTGLTSATIGKGVTTLQEKIFQCCDNLTSLEVSKNNAVYHSDGNCIIKTETKSLITGCANSTIPTDGSVISIGKYAFYGCTELTSITIPNSVTTISPYAFGGCTGITSITIPDSVTSIGSAFVLCSGLTSVTIGKGVTSIDDFSFYFCYKLVEIINNSSLNITTKSSGNGFVIDYALNVKKGGNSEIVNKDGYLFYTHNGNNYLLGYVDTNTDLILPANYNGESYEIYQYAFYYCNGLTSVTIPDSVTSIGDSAFYGCDGLTSITIGNSVTSIGDFAFYGCDGLTSITIPDSVTSIGDSAFYGCDGLTSITIGNSVTSIGYEAFYGCEKLKEIHYNGTKAEWEAIEKNTDWDGDTEKHTIYCTDGNIDK